MKNKLIFDCPQCSVFMRQCNDKGEMPRLICPICHSIFLPSQKAVEDRLKQHEAAKQIRNKK